MAETRKTPKARPSLKDSAEYSICGVVRSIKISKQGSGDGKSLVATLTIAGDASCAVKESAEKVLNVFRKMNPASSGSRHELVDAVLIPPPCLEVAASSDQLVSILADAHSSSKQLSFLIGDLLPQGQGEQHADQRWSANLLSIEFLAK